MDSKKCMLIYYLVVIIFIGLPIWYKTTSPVRYKLPDVKSLMVHSQRIISRIQISVIDVITNEKLLDENEKIKQNSNMNYNEMKEDLQNNWLRFDSQTKNIIYELQWIVRRLKDGIEDKLFDNVIDLNETDELSKQLKLRYKQGNLSIYLLSDQDWIRLTNKLNKKKPFKNVIYGSYRSFYVKKNYATCSNLADLVHKILDNQLNENDLYEINIESNNLDLVPIYSKTELIEAKIPKNVESSLMNLKLTIYLNIITEQLNDSITFQKSDDFKQIGKIRSKLLSELTGTNFNLNVISQMINYAIPDDLIANSLIKLKNDHTRLFDLNSVPELLNKIESRISPPSDKHTIEFNIIIPSSELYFYDKSNGRRSNAIVTPYQPNTLIWNKPNDFNLGFKSFVRKQLGLPFKQPTESLRRDLFFAKWEFDNLIRQITIKQLTKTLESLESLEKMLNKISNIVIEKETSMRMFNAIEYAHKSIDELENYGLSKAFEFSSEAFHNSENAYYDPSLLSLLYFPEDQKYAIYFPLFFPIAIQLGSYFYGLFKHRFMSKKKDIDNDGDKNNDKKDKDD